MEQDYRIEMLVGTFGDHASMTDKHHEQVINAFHEHNPGQELPPHMVNPFNISHALSAMCAEIAILKNIIHGREEYENICD